MKLQDIVTEINNSLKASLNQNKFQQGTYYGLAKLVSKKSADDSTEYIANIYGNDGSEIRCTVDDTNPFKIYHRCISISQAIQADKQFGDGGDTFTETANMIAVVYGKKSVIGMCQEDLASIVSASFPSNLIITGISNTVIKTNLVNNDSFTVFTQEYKSADYPLNPEDYYFSIGYTVETTFDKSCVDNCIC